jgi:hypothetical protein
MAFNIPINSIPPIATPSDWVRPSDWITITDTANEVQFLVCDSGAKAFTIRTTFTRTSGNIYIDWGDGVTDTISTTTSTDTSHIYSTGGTPSSRGYKTFKIRIYGDATCVITNAQHIVNFAVTGGNPFYNIGLLEAYFGNGTCNTSDFTANYFYSVSANLGDSSFSMLEYVKLPATVSWTSQMASMFRNCTNLYKVIMPTSASSLTDLSSCFRNCKNLLDITLPTNATSITTLNYTFSESENLRNVLLPDNLNNCVDLSNAFHVCTSIKTITMPSINLATNLSYCFNFCYSLQWVKFNSLPSPISSGTTINFFQIFGTCYSLQNVYFPESCSLNSVYQLGSSFQDCINLKNILFPVNFNASSLSGTFTNCYKLNDVVFQSTMPNLTNMGQCFNNCRNLKSITFPATVSSSGVNISSMFQGCISLDTIQIPSGWILTSLNNAFYDCRNITSIILPNNTQNSLTDFGGAFYDCHKLKTIILPTSLTASTNLSQMFFNCYELESVTFPATMNSVTAMQSTFQNCYNLTSITLPTSMTSLNTTGSAFQDCRSLTSITFPSSVAININYNQTFFSCINLKTITLPTTQTTSTNNITNMFTACGNLTTINNLDKVGSLTATPLVNGTITTFAVAATFANIINSLSFNCPFSVIRLQGSSTTQNFNKLNSLRLLNASAGQYTGSTPHINVSFCDLGITALNQLFTDLPIVTSKTINITSCTGAAGCTRTIATAKGWTVTG